MSEAATETPQVEEGTPPVEEGEGEAAAEDAKSEEATGPYADLKMPEGYEQIDDEALGAFKEMAEADKLPLESVQKYLDLFVNQMETMTGQWSEAITAEVKDQSQAWRKEGLSKGSAAQNLWKFYARAWVTTSPCWNSVSGLELQSAKTPL
jgi:hypothetical protein